MITHLTLAELAWILVGFSVVGLAALTLAGFFSRYHHYLDICDHFRMQYALLLICLSAVCLLGGRLILGFSAIGFFLVNTVLILPLFITPKGWKQGSKEYRFLIANVLRKNQSFSKLLSAVQANNPDFIALIEPNQTWMEALRSLDLNYPYQISSLREDNYGIALLSRYPLEDQRVHTLTDKGTPTLETKARVNGGWITIIVTHPPPPKSSLDAALRDQQMMKLVELVYPAHSSVILCGDFNTTPWSVPFRRMEKHGNLIDTSRGFGYQPTWPTDRFWLRIPIDQCLVSKDLSVTQRRVGPPIGSDHFPIIVDFRVNMSKISQELQENL